MASRELKIAIAGDMQTGKTCLVNRFTSNVFSDKYKTTIGADFKAKSIEVDGELVTLQIWDISGQYRTNFSVTKNFFKDASGVIITFSLMGSDNSMANVSEWRDQSRSVLDDDVPCVLVGTKSDLGKIDSTSIESMCQTENFHKWYQTSALTGEGIQELFEDLTRLMVDHQKRKEMFVADRKSNLNLDGGNSKLKKIGSCCNLH